MIKNPATKEKVIMQCSLTVKWNGRVNEVESPLSCSLLPPPPLLAGGGAGNSTACSICAAVIHLQLLLTIPPSTLAGMLSGLQEDVAREVGFQAQQVRERLPGTAGERKASRHSV